MTSTVEYSGMLRTTSTHIRSGEKIITDAPTDNNGKGEAFSPTDLLATSLGCCMLTIMGITAQKNAIRFEHCKAEITKIMAENPRRVGEIIVEVHVGEKGLSETQKKMLETAALNCPVAKSLGAEIKQSVSFSYE